MVQPVAQSILLVAEGVPAMLVTEQRYVVLAHKAEQAEVLASAVLELLQGPGKHELCTYTHLHIQTYTNKHICKDTACKQTYSHRYCSST